MSAELDTVPISAICRHSRHHWTEWIILFWLMLIGIELQFLLMTGFLPGGR